MSHNYDQGDSFDISCFSAHVGTGDKGKPFRRVRKDLIGNNLSL